MKYFQLSAAICFSVAMLATAQTKPPTASETPPARKSALDKAALEAYVRHLFVWGSQINVQVSDPKASPLPGFQQMTVRATLGNASQEETFHVSGDGQKIVRGTVFDVNVSPFQADIALLKTQGDPSFGPADAPVTLVVFSDFQCSFCKEEAKIIRNELRAKYPKEVRVVFKDFPLQQIHPWARDASMIGRCIAQQSSDGFWAYHDWIFAHQDEITPENLKTKVAEFAPGQKLDASQISGCLDAKTTEQDIDRTLGEARALQLNSTPTVFVNGRKMVGQVGFPQLQQVIDHEISYQKANAEACCEVKLSSPLNE